MSKEINIKIYKDQPYIKDKTLFKAVCFARRLCADGIPIGLAIYKSAKYYKIREKDVAQEMGRLGSHVREKRKNYGK